MPECFSGETAVFLRRDEMAILRWVLTFLILALIASLFGFGGAASSFAGIAKILLFVFVVLLVVSFFFGRSPR